ncbi:unnamed protein product [Closterium sp. NIES-53]
MALRPSSIPLRVPLPAPVESSLPTIPDLESNRTRAASPTISRLLATAITDPYFETAAASALVAEMLDFPAAYRLDYTTALVAESESTSPPSVESECALGTDVLEDRQEDLECLAAAIPRFASMLLAPEGDLDAPDIPTPRSYAVANMGPYSSKVKRPPDSPPAFKVRYVARGFSQRQGVDYFQTFSPTPKMTTFRVLLHVAAQRDYELHYLDFSTAFLQGSLHAKIWLRRPPGFGGSFRVGTQWSLWRPIYDLRNAPREWHKTVRTTLSALGFAPSTADPSLFLRTDTSLPHFYVLVYVDDLVFATPDTEALTLVKTELQKRHTCTDLGELRSYLGLQITRDKARRTITLTKSHMVHQVLQHFQSSGPYPELVGCLITSGMGLGLGGRGPVVPTGHANASLVNDSSTQRSSQGYTFSLEHRLEHRTKHIALRYFLVRELQQRGHLRLAYVATRANTADIFTNALPPGDHQRFSTVLGLCYMPSPDSIVGASPLMDPRFAVPFSPPLQSIASHSPIPTTAALSLPRNLNFVLDSAATDSDFRDAGVLCNFPRPVSIDGAGETMTMICTGTSSLPCPASPSGAVTGLYVHSIVIFITMTGTLLVSPFLLLVASTPFMFPSPLLSITLPLRLPLPSPLATVALSPNLPFFSIIALATPTSLSFAAWSIRSCLMISLPLSRPFPPLPLLHAPLVFKPSSPNGHRYFLLLVDDHSRFATVYPLCAKFDAPSLIICWAEQARLCFGRPVARLHSDGGGEFFNQSLSSYCSSHGIRQTSTLPHSPEQNGVAERRIRTLMEITRCLLTHSSAPHSLWSYALVHAILLSNLRPDPLRPSITPFQLWTGRQPSARPLRVWDCAAHVLSNPADRARQGGKLAPKTQLCAFIGINADCPGYPFFAPSSQQLIPS